MLKNKTIVVGVTGGIAAYKACDVVSRLKKLGANIHVIMTKSACEFVTPLTLQTLSSNFVINDMFKEPKTWEVEHIELAKVADLFLIVPASANFIGKVASGIADDMLTTTVMATRAKCIIAPAMNTNMYSNPIVQENIDKLRGLGYSFIEPASGILACGDVGKGKLADVDTIIQNVLEYFDDTPKDLEGIKIIVTAGPTIEAIDPVRYITNRSSGKMGYSIASQAAKRGARVTLVTGKTNIDIPKRLEKVVEIESAHELYTNMMAEFEKNDVIIQSAAVADYKPKSYSNKKIKKSDDDLVIELDRNKDVAKEIGKLKKDQVLVGFAAETNDLLENAGKKIKKKNLDFIVANDLTLAGAGFGTDTNIVKLIDENGNVEELPKCMKTEVADHILDKVKSILKTR